jgi:hypothetical protein
VARSRPAPLGAAVVLLVSVFALAGCGGKKLKPVYPTEGKLLINGQPVGNVTVFFHAVNQADAAETKSYATTEPDGSFKLTTRAAYDGGPAGEFVVTLLYEPLDSPLTRVKGKPPTFDKKYGDATTSPLKAKIEAKPLNTLEPFDVK